MPSPSPIRRAISLRLADLRNWWHWLTESQRERAKIMIVLVAVAVVGVPAYYLSRPLLRHWRHGQALAQAQHFAGINDYRSALLALRRATEIDPGNLNTWREVARYLAAVGSPESVVAHENMVRLAPADLALRMELVQEAIRFGKLEVARNSVAAIDAGSRRDAAFHRMAAALALALGQTAELDVHLSALVTSEPANVAARFNLAALRLWGDDAGKADAARAELVGLLQTPATRVRAALELLNHAARKKDRAAVDALVGQLLGIFAPGQSRAATAATGGEPPGWFVLIAGLQAAGAANPDDAALLVRWLDELRLSREALLWVESLPAEKQNARAVAAAAAEAAARLGDDRRLEKLLRAGAWGSIPDDAVALALASRLQRMRFNEKRGRDTWEDAVAACGDSLSGLGVLARLASVWRDTAGTEQVLQHIVDRTQGQLWAYHSLRTIYATGQKTEALWRLHARWVRVAPNDATVLRVWVLLSALLDRLDDAARTAAAEEHRRAPQDPTAAAAAAAVQWRAGRVADAIAKLEALPDAARAHPQVVFWSAVLRADLKNREAAQAALRRAWTLDLWPEERNLLRKAADKVGFKPSGA